MRVDPDDEWSTVRSGSAQLLLDDRSHIVETGDAASFSTMVSHATGALMDRPRYSSREESTRPQGWTSDVWSVMLVTPSELDVSSLLNYIVEKTTCVGGLKPPPTVDPAATNDSLLTHVATPGRNRELFESARNGGHYF